MRRLLARCARRREQDEGGSFAPAVPVIAFVLLILGGLGIDGSRALNARGQAVAFAEEAARSGALGIDRSQPVLVLDPPEVQRRVAAYCAAVLPLPQVTECQFVGLEQAFDPQNPGQRTDTDLGVRVRVETEIQPSLLALVYPNPIHASAEGLARPVEGLDTAGTEDLDADAP